MSIRTLASQLICSRRLRSAVHAWHGAARRARGRRRTLLVFLEPGEPYSELLAEALPDFARHYGLECLALAVPPPERAAAPEPQLLAEYAMRDAALLRAAYPRSPSGPALCPAGDPIANAARRRALGHYASGMVWFEGEWYWGLDRLHFLERRLGASEAELLFPPPREAAASTGGCFEMFFSLRSPYSYLALERVPLLAEQWQAQLLLKPVLPMVMRALPVPRAKRLYIVRDCKREAERLGIPFGRIEDPVGAGVERGLAILHRAIPAGTGLAFARSFARGVWAEGLNAASEQGLRRIVERAGLDWQDAQEALADPGWREAVERNREQLFALGLWGVPTFRVGEQATFGQDRLWQVGRWLAESSV